MISRNNSTFNFNIGFLHNDNIRKKKINKIIKSLPFFLINELHQKPFS